MDDKLLEKIQSCEETYKKCFSRNYETDVVVRYRDDNLKDMYNHNFTYIKKALPSNRLKELIEEETAINKGENKDFLRLTMDEMPGVDFLEESAGKLSLEHYGFYSYSLMKSPDWNVLKGYEIKIVQSSSMVEDLVTMDVTVDSERCGEDFCCRRARRKGKVYLSDETLYSYVCYNSGLPVGKCDLYLHEGTAKIEDFEVLPDYQRRGVGTTVLKYLIDQALNGGANTIYLVADEDDTPKEMYLKLGFDKVGETFALFRKFQ
jgi:spore maturation protein CgeE